MAILEEELDTGWETVVARNPYETPVDAVVFAPEKYRSIELDEQEAAALVARMAGKMDQETAEEAGVALPALPQLLRSAIAKAELQQTSATTQAELSPEAQSVVLLNETLGQAFWMWVSDDPAEQANRIRHYDELYGFQWRGNQPHRVTSQPEMINRVTQRILQLHGLVPEGKITSESRKLLSQSPDEHRRRAQFIHQRLLGHTKVRIHPEKTPLAQLVAERQAQKPKDRISERAQINRVVKLLQKKRGLAQMSIPMLEQWGVSKGLIEAPPERLAPGEKSPPKDTRTTLERMLADYKDHPDLRDAKGSLRSSFAGQDLMKAYLQEIGQYQLLTKADEYALWERICAGRRAYEAGGGDMHAVLDGLKAYYEFYKANLRLVVSIAAKYQGGGHDIELLDLIQVGNMGMSHAIDKFDGAKGFKFSTYATFWVKQALQREIQNRGYAIRIPVSKQAEHMRLFKAIDAFRVENKRLPTLQELVAEGHDREKAMEILEMQRSLRYLTYLDKELSDEGETRTGDLIADRNAVAPDAFVENMGRQQELEQLVEEVSTDRIDLLILSLRYGGAFAGVKAEEFGKKADQVATALELAHQNGKLSFADIGKVIGLTGEAARRRANAAINRFRLSRATETLMQRFNLSDAEQAEFKDYFGRASIMKPGRVSKEMENINPSQALLEVIQLCAGEELEAAIEGVVETVQAKKPERTEAKRAAVRKALRIKFGLDPGTSIDNVLRDQHLTGDAPKRFIGNVLVALAGESGTIDQDD